RPPRTPKSTSYVLPHQTDHLHGDLLGLDRLNRLHLPLQSGDAAVLLIDLLLQVLDPVPPCLSQFLQLLMPLPNQGRRDIHGGADNSGDDEDDLPDLSERHTDPPARNATRTTPKRTPRTTATRFLSSKRKRPKRKRTPPTTGRSACPRSSPRTCRPSPGGTSPTPPAQRRSRGPGSPKPPTWQG